jgi:hypothetical protein
VLSLSLSVAAWVVSSAMLLTGAPLRNVVMPRLRSGLGPVMVAPRSEYLERADLDDRGIVTVDLDDGRGVGRVGCCIVPAPNFWTKCPEKVWGPGWKKRLFGNACQATHLPFRRVTSRRPSHN